MNGEKVLVPVLYMAQANNRLAPNGALIQGTDVTLIAGKDLINAGTLKATNNLSAIAGQDMVSSGLVQAGDRLDLLASKNLTNKAGGIIGGKDVALTALTGDVVNERTVTASQIAYGKAEVRNDYVDSAARVEAVNDLGISAGRDINNIGGVLQSGRDLKLGASRDVNLASAQATNSLDRGVNRNSSTTTQYSASVSAGRDVSVQAGRDITVVASDINAERDIAMVGAGDVTIASAADENHFLFKSKKLTIQKDHVQQVASNINAGGSIAVSAGNDMAVISSRVTAGKEAYLAAGNKLDVFAAQDSDYSLYDEKSKGSFGSKKTKRDEVTQVTNISSQITSGGNMVLASGGDQHYQAAKLNSGEDLFIKSGGSVTFEAVKDLHQENHEKSNTSMVWNATKGKGNTDETLRQTQILAKGTLVIQAVNGLKIDIKQIDQHTVSQTIDAMVKADPKLAWLKEAEKRGDVDWRKVQEVHDSFKYNNSSLGGGAALVIAIIVTYFTWGLGAQLVGVAATSTTGLAASAVYTGVAIKAATSTINNKGNLGEIAKDVTSGESLKGYAIAGLSGPIAKFFGVTGAFTAADLGRQLAVNSALKTVINGGSFGKNVGQAAIDLTASLLSGMIYEKVGSALVGSDLPTKVAVHAIVGGLIAEAAGGDFASAAIAAGANKALIQAFGEDLFPGEAHERLLAMTSQLIGMTVAAGLGGSAKDQEVAGWVAQQGTIYNELQHKEVEALIDEAKGCEVKNNCKDIINKYADLNEANEKRLNAICESDPTKCKDAYSEWVASYDKTHELISQVRASGTLPAEVGRMLAAVDLLNITSRMKLVESGIVQGGLESATSAAAGFGIDVTPETLSTISKWAAVLFGVKKAGAAGLKMPTALPDNLTGYANPKDIRFSQGSVKNEFSDGRSLQASIDALLQGNLSPADIPAIRVFEKGGLVYTLDNRRLLAASAAGVPIKITPATPAEVAKEAWKMTTPNEGTIICVRGICE